MHRLLRMPLMLAGWGIPPTQTIVSGEVGGQFVDSILPNPSDAAVGSMHTKPRFLPATTAPALARKGSLQPGKLLFSLSQMFLVFENRAGVLIGLPIGLMRRASRQPYTDYHKPVSRNITGDGCGQGFARKAKCLRHIHAAQTGDMQGMTIEREIALGNPKGHLTVALFLETRSGAPSLSESLHRSGEFVEGCITD